MLLQSVMLLAGLQSVLPLLGPLLQRVPSKVFMTQTLVAGLALHPAMMHSWLVQHTANANFAFAACALLAAWQVGTPHCMIAALSSLIQIKENPVAHVSCAVLSW